MFFNRRLIFPFLLSISILASAQRGALTAPSNLEHLTSGASLIVHGFITSAHVEPHPELSGLQTVVVQLKVVDVLKGQSGEFLTFRQFIWDARDRVDAAGYHKGQELVLLLNAPSKLGLRSPVGLEQGRFTVRHLAGGQTRAINGNGNFFLFSSAEGQTGKAKSKVVVPPTLVTSPGSVSLDSLKQLIRAYAGGAQ